MRPTTRYADSGGVRIAYQVVGTGPRDVILAPGFVSNVDQFWESPAWSHIFQRLAAFARLVLWDKRGTGLSDPVTRVPTLDERADDLRAVMDAAECERPALLGVSEGGPMSLVFAASRPERISALVLYGTSPRFSRATDWEWGWTAEQIDGWLGEIDRAWGAGALLDLFAPSVGDNPVAREQWGRLQRAGASPAMARAVMEALVALDCRPVLSTIDVPTLIVHRTGDRVAHVEAARFMASRIRGARFVELPSSDHALSSGDPDPLLDEIERFLTGSRPHGIVTRVLATVLFLDIVGSTALAAKLGDRRWHALLESHRSLIRRELTRFDGREVKTMGDGFLATFSAPSRAIACACAIRDGTAALGLALRAGLHTGECETVEDEIGGLAVHIGARVGGLAQAGEVLVTGTVRDLVAGSELAFSERGTHQLRGVPGEWPIYGVEAG
jgi:class 3 adenylate cyclase